MSGDESLHLDPELAPYAEVEGKYILSPEIVAGCRALFGNAWLNNKETNTTCTKANLPN